ncbi:hypothetical protein IQ06DRAFT_4558 [Phaeosphaeriaceae sp. SRC1lsM3a]|nr:hypothetical protein IQ06DRAFT_4558 [Stagonospora sp. SRC1lsM3a]
MAVLAEHIAQESTSTRKTHQPLGVVRHLSAPARFRLALGQSAVGDVQDRKSERSIPGSPRQPGNAAMSSTRLLRQLSVAQVIVCRLRLDNRDWRANAERHETQLIANEEALQMLQHLNALLEEECAVLRAEHQASVAINNKMLHRLQMAVISQEKLVSQLKDLEREIARLKKSDRAKGKV